MDRRKQDMVSPFTCLYISAKCSMACKAVPNMLHMLGCCFIPDKAPAQQSVSPAATLHNSRARRIQSKHKAVKSTRQAEVSGMAQMSRDEKREVAKGLRMEEARLKNEEAHAKAAQRIAAALAADKTIQQQKLAAYSDKQSQNTQRRA